MQIIKNAFLIGTMVFAFSCAHHNSKACCGSKVKVACEKGKCKKDKSCCVKKCKKKACDKKECSSKKCSKKKKK